MKKEGEQPKDRSEFKAKRKPSKVVFVDNPPSSHIMVGSDIVPVNKPNDIIPPDVPHPEMLQQLQQKYHPKVYGHVKGDIVIDGKRIYDDEQTGFKEFMKEKLRAFTSKLANKFRRQ